jgi:quercetin dioxygenase-like cupin family protein
MIAGAPPVWLLQVATARARRSVGPNNLTTLSITLLKGLRIIAEVYMSDPDASLQPYVRQATEHQRLAYGGAELAVILDAAITGGQLSVFDTHSRRGDASPVHVHSRDDEAFLVLDGQMTVWVGQERHILSAGGIAFLPRNIPHAVRCDIATRALVLSAPAGSQETVFRTAGWDLSRPMPEGWQPAPDALREAAEQAGVTLIGPPHGLDD